MKEAKDAWKRALEGMSLTDEFDIADAILERLKDPDRPKVKRLQEMKSEETDKEITKGTKAVEKSSENEKKDANKDTKSEAPSKIKEKISSLGQEAAVGLAVEKVNPRNGAFVRSVF